MKYILLYQCNNHIITFKLKREMAEPLKVFCSECNKEAKLLIDSRRYKMKRENIEYILICGFIVFISALAFLSNVGGL